MRLRDHRHGAVIDAVVIGAGQAGLAVSHHLSRHGIEHVVLERGSVGESWRSQRWDSFALNSPNWMNRLPGDAEDVAPRDGFLTRDQFVDRLVRYGEAHRVPLRTGVQVTSVEQGADGGLFLVSTSGPDADATGVVEARSVVVAAGMQRTPRLPALAGNLPGWLRQVPASGYRRPGDLPTGAVLVVGSGQSGVQIAEDLLAAGRIVYLCASVVARFPRRYRGRDCFEWLVDAGFFEVALDGLPDPRMRSATLPTISGLGRHGHTVSLQGLATQGAILLGRPSAAHGDRLALDDTIGAAIAFGDRTSAEMKAGVDKGLREHGRALPAVEPDAADEPHPDPSAVHSPPELHLGTAGIGSVVWATGFRGDLGFIRPPVLDAEGLPRHERGVGHVPGTYFVGFPWLSKRKSGLIHGVDEDAAFVADRLAGDLVAAG